MHVSDLNHTDTDLQKKLEYIYGLRTGSKINWDGEAYLSLLNKLGNPHKSLPPILHVAGTNGKGSVVAMLRSVFEAAGYSVHTYTSPHLQRVNERIVLAGAEITNEQLHEIFDEVLFHCNGYALSFFEIITAAAFLIFSRIPADVLLLEVGMGGKLDCTNVVTNVLVSIINRISLDHTEFLGETIDLVATQKAGIIKKGVPCVLGFQGENSAAKIISNVVEDVANLCEAPLYIYGRDWSVEKKSDGFLFCESSQCRHFPMPALLGVHQMYNAGLIIKVVSLICDQFVIEHNHILAGLLQVKWEGRLQKIEVHHHDRGDADVEFWLDCGHNDSAGEILAQQMDVWQKSDSKDTILVVAMLGKKDFLSFIQPLLPFCSSVYCIGINNEPSSMDPVSARNKIFSLNPEIEIYAKKDIHEALEHIFFDQVSKRRVLIAGSVYLAGEVLHSFKV